MGSDMKRLKSIQTGPVAGTVAGIAVVLLLGGCDVTNPGPVQDQFLSDPAAHQGLVNGAGRMLVESANLVFMAGGLTSREIFPVGSTNFSIHPRIQRGELPEDLVINHWANPQEARFIAEEAIRRFNAIDGVQPQVLAQAYTFAGYANRLLGENMCNAVFDGGPSEPNAKYFERAEQHFTNAITIATGDLRMAAIAGRAQVRVWRRNWTGAESDAAQVPVAFNYSLATDSRDQAIQNILWWSNANRPYRTYSVWMTYFDGYYDETGDPRTPWGADSRFPVGEGSISGFQVPWKFGLKYVDGDATYRFASGREMQLIRAEALLQQGQWAQAMALINGIRTVRISQKTNLPLNPWVATTLNEAWAFLKRERSIELWLEGRRLGDLRRWEETATPGVLDWPDFESVAAVFSQAPRARCFPISQTEREVNPNLRG
jgi:hypothetical protein